MKNTFNRGYSLTEVVVSIALIVMVSVTGFLACGAAVVSRNNSYNHMQMISSAEACRTCFELTLDELGKSESDEGKTAFVVSFTDKLAFCFGASQLTEAFSELDLTKREEQSTLFIAGDGLHSEGVTAHYYGADRAGITFAFDYECVMPTSRIVCRIDVRGSEYYFAVEGYLKGSERVAYRYEKRD